MCDKVADKEHFFQQCDSMREATVKIKTIAHKVLQKGNVNLRDLLFFSYKGRSKNKNKVFTWFLIKVYKRMFYGQMCNMTEIMTEVLKDLNFAEINKFELAGLKEFGVLKENILKLM